MGQGRDERPRHVDLTNERGIRFGAQCEICAARYATPLQPLAADTSEQELREAKDEVIGAFTAAWHELEIECYRCGRTACPLCWDADNRMCAACVAEHGLTRSPFRGVGASGPLADGRLQVVETGRYGDVSRPAWLGDLLEHQSNAGRPAPTGPGGPPPGGLPLAAEAAQHWMLAGGSADSAHSAHEVYADAPYVPVNASALAAAQTMRMAAAASGEEVLPIEQRITRKELGGDTAAHIPNLEGAATSTMVDCPRCGTKNYDFVTRCTVCQLQLIQICPLCEKLNPGQATRCEFCGSPLNRPRGWSGVINQQRITASQLNADEDRIREMLMGGPRDDIYSPASAPMPRSNSAGPWDGAGYGGAGYGGVGYGGPVPAVAPQAATLAPAPLPSRAAPRPGGGRPGRRPTMAPRATGAPGIPGNDGATVAMTLDDILGAGAGQDGRTPSRAGTVVERLISLALLAIIALILGSVVAAELSPQVNAALRSIVHVDVRQTLDHFAQQLQLIVQRNSR